MNQETARGLLGIGSTASHSEIETAWQHRQDEVLARLKRANIWLDDDNQARLMDFGIAKLMTIRRINVVS